MRKAAGAVLVTYKGVVEEGANSLLKIREEIESDAGDPDSLIALFERLGFRPVFRYQKYRTGYGLAFEGRELEVEFDETPMGNFIEIEGDEPAVLRVLEGAAFPPRRSFAKATPSSGAALRSAGIPLEDLVFEESEVGP